MRRSLVTRGLKSIEAASGLLEPHRLSIIGAPMKFGQGRGGTEMGPTVLRIGGASGVGGAR